jgi:hypothetical protein
MIVRAIAYIALLAVLLCSGCGSRQEHRAAIGGEVKLDGKPVELGSIQFLPMQGVEGPLAGGTIEKGRFTLSTANGPAIGRNRVEIRASRKSGRMVHKMFAPPSEMVDAGEEAVAPRFNSESTLTFDVKPGENVASFDVVSK